jgi:tetratricopeptide (TPR) repeat protein
MQSPEMSTGEGQGELAPPPREGATAGPPLANSWRLTILAAAAIVLAAVGAYHNSFSGVLIYDDVDAIIENQTIRRLWPIWSVLSPPRGGQTVSGRPLVNLSLAINYAASGEDVWSYHLTNLLIHIAAALLLFGILRRTFLMPVLRDRFGRAATPLALAAALIWTVHPLQAESVTYVVQRAESLAGLFYLLTLYCVIRGAAPGTVPFFAADKPILPDAMSGEKGDCPPWSASVWYAAAVLSCLLGIACKEILVTAPLMVLLYDRTFLVGSFAQTLRRRWGLYLSLAATWGLLAYLVYSTGLIHRQPEMGAPDAWSYARSQPGVILHYLRLSVWPHPLCFDCDWPVANTVGEILPGVVVLGLLLAATVWGLMARRVWGFLGAWFLLILAPTSSVFPLGELAYEHRLYLPLAAVVVLAVAGGYALWDRLLPRPAGPGGQSPFSPGTPRGRVGLWAAKKGTVPGPAAIVRWAAPPAMCAAVLAALGCATVARNSVYRSLLVFWQDAADKRPDGFFAQYYLGNAMASLDRPEAAIKYYQLALRRKPDYAPAHYNLANVLAAVEKNDEAIEHLQEALRLTPKYPEANNNLGNALVIVGRTEEAIERFRQALRLKPDYAEAHSNLGSALLALGKTNEAIDYFRRALRLNPDYAEAHSNLGSGLLALGRTNEAIDHFHQALRLKPHDASAHNNLGFALAALGRTDEAIVHFNAALQVKPDDAGAHYNLGNVLAGMGRTQEAIDHLSRTLRLKPDHAEAHNNLATVLATVGKTDEAIDHFHEALRLKPNFALALENLSHVLAAAGRTSEAIESYHRLLQLTPDSLASLLNLAWLLATSETAAGGDPAEAVRLAQRARELSGRENAACLDTLAAAYAAAGRFGDAVIVAERALQLAESAGEVGLAAAIRSRLELYRAERPYRETRRAVP